MKKTLLFAALMVISSVSSFAQSDSDDPIYNSPVVNNLTQAGSSLSKTIVVGGMTINGEILPCDSSNTTLTVAGACSYQWFSDSLGANLLATDIDLSLTGLTGDTTLYLAAVGPDTAIGLPLPPHDSNFSGNVRGYWFQASSDFVISALTIPTEASTGASSMGIFRFNSGPPPLFSGTTNDFTMLGLWQNELADTVFTCIVVDSGQYIGVLGNRGNVNSYATAPYASSINGIPTTLGRLGMQFSISTTAPQDVWQEAGGSISRVELIYGNLGTTGAIIPINVTVPTSTTGTAALSICNGDSTLLGGTMQSISGVYVDSLLSVNGCDSIVSTTLTVEPAITSSETLDLCDGDSLLINGAFVYTNSTYVDSLTSAAGCDSLATITAVFSTVDGSATQAGFVLSATSATGTYQWVDCNNGNAAISGATSQSYTATANGSYAVQVTVNGCSAMSACFDYTTIGIDEYDLGTAFSIYPNPTLDIVNYTFNGSMTMDFVLTNVAGKVIWSGTSSTNEGTIDLGAYAAGTYLLDVSNGDKRATIRLIKK